MHYFDLTPRGQKIASCLSMLGASPKNQISVAAEMDRQLGDSPDEQAIRTYVDAHGILPGFRDNGHGGLMRSNTDVAAFIAERLQS
jgi:hypothetical protein